MLDHSGTILVIAKDEKPARRLGRWITGAGKRPILVHGPDIRIFERGDDTMVDVVVTELDPQTPDAGTILEKLVRGNLFPGVPQLHCPWLEETFRVVTHAGRWSWMTTFSAVEGPRLLATTV